MYSKMIKKILNPIWIVNEGGEMGIRIFGVNFYYYKWEDPMINQDAKWRVAYKREFGECVISRYGFYVNE